jgi:hypothetical protein
LIAVDYQSTGVNQLTVSNQRQMHQPLGLSINLPFPQASPNDKNFVSAER